MGVMILFWGEWWSEWKRQGINITDGMEPELVGFECFVILWKNLSYGPIAFHSNHFQLHFTVENFFPSHLNLKSMYIFKI